MTGSIIHGLFDPDPTRPPAPAPRSSRDLGDDGPASGLERLGPGDLRLPRLRLRQPLTRDAEQVPEGSWFLSSDPGYHSLGRELVVLDVRKERRLVLPDEGGAEVAARIAARTGVEVAPDLEGPVCRSSDGVVPDALEGRTALAPACAACPMSRWRTVDGRRRLDCADGFRLVVVDLLTQRPCLLLARGSAVRPARELLAALETQCARHGRPAWAFALFALTRRVEGPSGPYFVPVFHAPYLVDDPAQVAFHAALRRRIVAGGEAA